MSMPVAGDPGRRHRLLTGVAVVSVFALGSLSPGPAAADRSSPPAARGAAEGQLAAIQPPSPRTGSWAAKILMPTVVRDAPDGAPVWWAETATSFNRQAQYLLVLGAVRTPAGREWLRVRLPVRPNTAAGWIPRDRALLVRRRDWITVDLRRRQVIVHRARGPAARPALVRRDRAVVGAAATPTPTGLFAIYETVRQPDPSGFLGNWALHLTAHSDVLFDFGGGDGRVAIHGRGGDSLATPLGTAASNGCIRMTNRFMGWLRKTGQPGTPVRVLRR